MVWFDDLEGHFKLKPFYDSVIFFFHCLYVDSDTKMLETLSIFIFKYVIEQGETAGVHNNDRYFHWQWKYWPTSYAHLACFLEKCCCWSWCQCACPHACVHVCMCLWMCLFTYRNISFVSLLFESHPRFSWWYFHSLLGEHILQK